MLAKTVFKIQESSITTIGVDKGEEPPRPLDERKYKDANDAYETAINYLATQEVGAQVTITQDITLKRTK